MNITCPKCDGDMEIDSETLDRGDGPWFESYIVGYVLREGPFGSDECFRTTCGCEWAESDFEELDMRATKAVNDYE